MSDSAGNSDEHLPICANSGRIGAMLTFFCPNCWNTLAEGAAQCPHCAFNLREAAHRSYDERLIAALRHRVPEYRVTAAQILGRRGCAAALPEFRCILETEHDIYLLRAVLRALKNIEEPLSIELIQSATRHRSRLVASLAASLLTQMAAVQFPSTEWETAAAR